MYIVTEKATSDSNYYYITHYETFAEALMHTHKAILERVELGLRAEDFDLGEDWVRYEMHNEDESEYFELSVDKVVLKKHMAL